MTKFLHPKPTSLNLRFGSRHYNHQPYSTTILPYYPTTRDKALNIRNYQLEQKPFASFYEQGNLMFLVSTGARHYCGYQTRRITNFHQELI